MVAACVAASACVKKGPELQAAEAYEREACGCTTSACFRAASHRFHLAVPGALPSRDAWRMGKVLSRALGCGGSLVDGACDGPDAGCKPGFSCLPDVGAPAGAKSGSCWRD